MPENIKNPDTPFEDREDLTRQAVGGESARTDDLLARNVYADDRQDKAEERIGHAEVRGARNREEIITLRDIYDIADSRMERLEGSMTRLVDTTNHRLDEFTVALAKKADVQDVGISLIKQLARSKPFLTIISTYVLLSAPIIVDHWRMLLERIDVLHP